MKDLEDQFGRKFPYLRMSITDICNFRCGYCLPDGYQKTCGDKFLSTQEIIRLIRVFASLGTQKVRLTGGEPALRRDLPSIASALSCISGIKTIAITTNGYNLKNKAQEFFDSGISALNVSVDSLSPQKFHSITGHNKLPDVLAGVEAARKAGFRKIKINTVLLKGINDDDLPEFLGWIKREELSVRFIELMQTGDNLEYFNKHHQSAETIKQKLIDYGFSASKRAYDAGPAQEFEHPEYKGKIGLIAPYSKDFCKTCNRLRVTARGDLRLCLFGDSGYSLRPFLVDDRQTEELKNKILELLNFKRESHYLGQGITGITPHLASLGG
ncbi:MAG: GTP 3',8-cyclase MoaA [Rickettsiales bacterium]